MKQLNRLSLLAALVAGLAAFPALRADDKPDTPPTPEQPETPKTPDKPEVEKSGSGTHRDLDNLRVPDRFKDDAKLQELIAAAKAQRDTFVAAQQDLAKQLKGATAEVKATVKEQLKANREKFLEDTKQLRTDIRERIKELVAELKPGNIQDAGEKGGHGRRGGG